MNDKSDELSKKVAQSVTRRAALRQLGFGVAGMALACFGLANKAGAKGPLKKNGYCGVIYITWDSRQQYTGYCYDPSTCQNGPSSDCAGYPNRNNKLIANPCVIGGELLDPNKSCSF